MALFYQKFAQDLQQSITLLFYSKRSLSLRIPRCGITQHFLTFSRCMHPCPSRFEFQPSSPIKTFPVKHNLIQIESPRFPALCDTKWICVFKHRVNQMTGLWVNRQGEKNHMYANRFLASICRQHYPPVDNMADVTTEGCAIRYPASPLRDAPLDIQRHHKGMRH